MHAKHVHRQRLALVEDAHSMALQRCALLFKNTGALQAARTRLPAVVVTGMLAFFANSPGSGWHLRLAGRHVLSSTSDLRLPP